MGADVDRLFVLEVSCLLFGDRGLTHNLACPLDVGDGASSMVDTGLYE